MTMQTRRLIPLHELTIFFHTITPWSIGRWCILLLPLYALLLASFFLLFLSFSFTFFFLYSYIPALLIYLFFPLLFVLPPYFSLFFSFSPASRSLLNSMFVSFALLFFAVIIFSPFSSTCLFPTFLVPEILRLFPVGINSKRPCHLYRERKPHDWDIEIIST